MENNEKNEFAKILNDIFIYAGISIDGDTNFKPIMQIYWDQLKPYTLSEVREAIRISIRNWEFSNQRIPVSKIINSMLSVRTSGPVSDELRRRKLNEVL